jgi:hypothetical protein
VDANRTSAFTLTRFLSALGPPIFQSRKPTKLDLVINLTTGERMSHRATATAHHAIDQTVRSNQTGTNVIERHGNR